MIESGSRLVRRLPFLLETGYWQNIVFCVLRK